MIQTTQYVLVVESGGTKCISMILNGDSELLGYGWGGATNQLFAGGEAAVKSVTDSIVSALGSAGIPSYLVTDVAATILMSKELFSQALEQAGIDSKASYINEKQAALAAALNQNFGIVASSGTGSFVYGRSVKGNSLVVGAFGPLLGDEGSGYKIGLNGLISTIHAMDGRGKPTALVQELCQSFEVHSNEIYNTQTAWQLANKTYDHYPYGNQSFIAKISRSVAKMARSGDSVSLHIIQEAGFALADQVVAVLQQLDIGTSPVPISYSGGVWNIGALILDPFRRRLAEVIDIPFELRSKKLEPVFGTYLLWKNKGIDMEWNHDLLNVLSRNNQEIFHNHNLHNSI